mgnify:CR=1 FL=1
MSDRGLLGRLTGAGRDGPGPWLFAAGCAVLSLLFYRSFVADPGTMLFGTDMIEQAYQARRFAVQELEAGRGLPLWNPFVYGGQPYLAILPGPIYYPTSLLYLAMPLFRAIGWTFVIHTALAGALGYGAGRAFGLRRWSSAVTGAAFMFTGYVVSTLYGGHDGRMFAMVLIPGVFACAERGFREREPAWLLLMGLVVACQVFTPHTQLMYFSSLAVSLYAAWRLAPEIWSGGEERRAALRMAGWFAAAFVAAAVVGAVQLWPTLELLPDAVRGGGRGGYEFAASWDMPPQELTALFLPDLMGSLRSYWGTNPFKLHTEYLGAGTLALAMVAWAAPRGDRRVWFLVVASALGVAFSLGDATPVHRIAYELVPMVDRFRAPNMMTGPVAFFVALSAGFGVERILAARRGRPDGNRDGGSGEERRGPDGSPIPWPVVLGLSAPFLLLSLWAALAPEGLLRWTETTWLPAGHPRRPPDGLAGTLRVTGAAVTVVWAGTLAVGRAVARRRWPRWTLAAVVLVLVADLWRVDARYLDTVEPDRAFRAGPLVERMRSGLEDGERVWQLQGTFGKNELMYWRIPSVTGMQNFRLAWYDGLVGGVGQRELLQRPALWPLLDLRYLTVDRRVGTPLLEEEARADGTRLYRVTADLPHAFFPDSVSAVGGHEEAVRRTRSLEDPVSVAYVEPADGAPPPAAGRGRARLVRWRPDELALEVEAERGGLLFVSEVWHPGWTARVDGREVPIHRTDAAFRGVVVPEGEHRVLLTYRSPPVRTGAIASLAGLLAVAAGLGWRWRRRSEA